MELTVESTRERELAVEILANSAAGLGGFVRLLVEECGMNKDEEGRVQKAAWLGKDGGMESVEEVVPEEEEFFDLMMDKCTHC